MKKLINLTIIAVACLAAACHKDAAVTRLAPVAFTSSIKASTSSVVLSATTDATDELTLTWPAVVYPVKAHVTYTLQADLPADTIGTTGWANAASIAVGNDILTKTLNGADLNTLAFKLGAAPNTAAPLVFRVQAYQDRYAYTQAVAVSVTTFKVIIVSHGYPVLYLPGDYQGWQPTIAPTAAAPKANIYEGYINEVAGGTYQFKFTSAPDWNHINYGDGGGGKLTTDGLAAGMTLPGPGFYEVSANLNTNTWAFTLTTWSILGDASPGGWTTDTQLTYDATKKVWSVTCNMKAAGSFKFRANDAWVIDFGIDANGQLAYNDSPVFGYDSTIQNITVPADGNYTITLDLHDPNNYNYTLHKN